MGVDDENLGSDAEMSGGVVQSDVAGGDPGPETKSRRAVGVCWITRVCTCVPHRFCPCPLTKHPANALYTLYSIEIASRLTTISARSVNHAAHAR